MSWFTIEEIDSKTFALSEYGHAERAHSYLLLGKRRAVLIDTGLGISNIRKEVDKLTSLPIVVLTTHSHWDHLGGHRFFQDIRIHPQDAGWLEHGIPLPTGEIERALSDEKFLFKKPAGFDATKYQIFAGRPNILLGDGEEIDLGGRSVEFIHTPGHSPGHICVYEKETGYLATGDLVYDGTLYCNFPSTSPSDYLVSINKISDISVSKIFPGHNSLETPPSQIKKIQKLLSILSDKGELQHGHGLAEESGIRILL